MKTGYLLTILMIGMIMGAYAQKPAITLTFTADNNGQYVLLNSILIENQTQGGDTTLYAPDTILVLDYIVGMEEVSDFNGKGFSLSQNYPNPIKGNTTISFRMPESEGVLVTVSDIMGRELINQEFYLERGKHSFTFYPGRESLYFLTAHAVQQSRTIKMVNSPSNAHVSGYCKLEYNGQQNTGLGEHKSENALNNFVFNLDDQLKFTTSTGLGERSITSSPTADKTYYFNYTGDLCPGTPTVTDIDGNVYNTVQIGDQCWMKENLKTTNYNNGTAIPNVTENSAWGNLATGAYVWYDNDINWKDSYGALYNWYATVDPNGLCPTGWHVPTNDEWTELTDSIGGTAPPHGDELKSCRRIYSPLGGGCIAIEPPRWHLSSSNWGTDEYGFSCLPGGYRDPSSNFGTIGYTGHWWSTTEYSSNYIWSRHLNYTHGNVLVNNSNKHLGLSVRCLRDY